MPTEKKKEFIYEAALSLIDESDDVSKIKVVDIAEKANIGKGTVYEYFSSKEQLIAESITYMLKKWINHLEDSFGEERSFKENYTLMLESVLSLMEKKHRTILGFISMSESGSHLYKSLNSLMKDSFEELQKSNLQFYEKIVDKSVEDGIIEEKPPLFDWYFAISSSILCVIIHEKHFEGDVGYNHQEIIEKAYNTYIKLLS
ncbi:TetR/AcrR family transcriptional regulator [Proteinivorax hydrogeniformans]|uniref:TetR/AcrR family transcriptional regulator n=1 Tax=Proteinivorax hydrogeniformans TaxID=1826727 RepID=A0AAU8HUQ2_9FIRM